MNDKTAPMDPGAPEGVAAPRPTRERNTYGMSQLIKEVTDLFPGVIYEVSNRSPRGVAFDVQFVPYGDDTPGLTDLLMLVESDPRVDEIVADSEGILVSFHHNPRIMDLRDSFALAEAWTVLTGEEHHLSFPGGFDAEHDGPGGFGDSL